MSKRTFRLIGLFAVLVLVKLVRVIILVVFFLFHLPRLRRRRRKRRRGFVRTFLGRHWLVKNVAELAAACSGGDRWSGRVMPREREGADCFECGFCSLLRVFDTIAGGPLWCVKTTIYIRRRKECVNIFFCAHPTPSNEQKYISTLPGMNVQLQKLQSTNFLFITPINIFFIYYSVFIIIFCISREGVKVSCIKKLIALPIFLYDLFCVLKNIFFLSIVWLYIYREREYNSILFQLQFFILIKLLFFFIYLILRFYPFSH